MAEARSDGAVACSVVSELIAAYALTEINAVVCRIDARGIMHLAVALAGLMKVL